LRAPKLPLGGLGVPSIVFIPRVSRYKNRGVFLCSTKKFDKKKKLLNEKKHLTLAGLQQIVSLKATLNFGLSENLKKEFPNLSVLERPNYNPDNTILNPDWISGL
jgi:hypothetical protein